MTLSTIADYLQSKEIGLFATNDNNMFVRWSATGETMYITSENQNGTGECTFVLLKKDFDDMYSMMLTCADIGQAKHPGKMLGGSKNFTNSGNITDMLTHVCTANNALQ